MTLIISETKIYSDNAYTLLALVVFATTRRKIFVSLILPSLPFVRRLSLVVFFDLNLQLNYAFESISRLLRAHRPPCILH